MNVPSENPQVFYRVDGSMSIRWMQQGMMLTSDAGKNYFPHADWMCIRTKDAHNLAWSIEWTDLAIIVRRKELQEKLHGLWRGAHVREVGPKQLAQRRIDVARHNQRIEMEQRYYEQ